MRSVLLVIYNAAEESECFITASKTKFCSTDLWWNVIVILIKAKVKGAGITSTPLAAPLSVFLMPSWLSHRLHYLSISLPIGVHPQAQRNLSSAPLYIPTIILSPLPSPTASLSLSLSLIPAECAECPIPHTGLLYFYSVLFMPCF